MVEKKYTGSRELDCRGILLTYDKHTALDLITRFESRAYPQAVNLLNPLHPCSGDLMETYEAVERRYVQSCAISYTSYFDRDFQDRQYTNQFIEQENDFNKFPPYGSKSTDWGISSGIVAQIKKTQGQPEDKALNIGARATKGFEQIRMMINESSVTANDPLRREIVLTAAEQRVAEHPGVKQITPLFLYIFECMFQGDYKAGSLDQRGFGAAILALADTMWPGDEVQKKEYMSYIGKIIGTKDITRYQHLFLAFGWIFGAKTVANCFAKEEPHYFEYDWKNNSPPKPFQINPRPPTMGGTIYKG